MAQLDWEKIIKSQNLNAAKDYIENGKLDQLGQEDKTAFILSMFQIMLHLEDHEFFNFIKKKNIDVNVKSRRNITPLITVSSFSNRNVLHHELYNNVIRFLIEKGVDPSVVDDDGDHLVRYLVKHHAKNQKEELINFCIKHEHLFTKDQRKTLRKTRMETIFK